ncbi:MAG: zinc finger CCHC domain-containing protein, partial [archaeon]|nr:zinc finger CCHC domain-containing protein [archaeon]
MNKLNFKTKAPATQQCQKCLQFGHWTFECQNQQKYIYRPSRSRLFKSKEYTSCVAPMEEPPVKVKQISSDDSDSSSSEKEDLKIKNIKKKNNEEEIREKEIKEENEEELEEIKN